MKKHGLYMLLAVLLIGQQQVSMAQKLPNTQNKGVILPAAFKIDGLAEEWGNNFQAYNKNTNIYTTMANNDQFLYLVVQAAEPIIIKKIIGGGISFTVCAAGKRSDPNPFAVTYPLVDNSYQTSIYSTVNLLRGNAGKSDSLVEAANSKIAKESKTIKIRGFRTIGDSIISIYNKNGIKAASRVSDKGTLTCEFLIPLKLLHISGANKQTIAYNIMLNSPTVLQSTSTKKGKLTAVAISIPRSLSNNESDSNVIQYPTDYWGEYTFKN